MGCLSLRLWLAVVIALTTPQALGSDPLKVGFVYVGPVGDYGWTYRHDRGRLALEEALGDRVTTSFVENVAEGADAERVIRLLAASGHGLIFTTSFGFMNPTVKVARQFPAVKFEHATGYKRGPNLATYMARFYEGRYVAGLISGAMTETDTIGYVASFPIPEVVRGINAFTLGLRTVNPKAQVRVVWVNTWYDPPKEADAAKTLIDQGSDIIVQHTDSPAPVQVAQERGVYAVGQASDMSRFGPDAHLTAIIDIWDQYYIDRAQAVLDGSWASGDTWLGLEAGLVEMGAFNPAIPDAVQQRALEAIAAIKAGELHPFQGPIVNQAGETVIEAGAALDDEALLTMDYYVEGVLGNLP
ncbi:MAG: BMP family ABC transporter substrate-binding protein [Candidatus Competibacterales bacterium]